MATNTTQTGTAAHPSHAAMASAIRAALDEAGISRMDAADLALIPRTTFYRKAEGVGRAFTVDELAAIARVLGTTVSALVVRAEAVAA